jgi:hypothetical protein
MRDTWITANPKLGYVRLGHARDPVKARVAPIFTANRECSSVESKMMLNAFNDGS